MILKCHKCESKIDTATMSVYEMQSHTGEKENDYCSSNCIDNTIVL